MNTQAKINLLISQIRRIDMHQEKFMDQYIEFFNSSELSDPFFEKKLECGANTFELLLDAENITDSLNEAHSNAVALYFEINGLRADGFEDPILYKVLKSSAMVLWRMNNLRKIYSEEGML